MEDFKTRLWYNREGEGKNFLLLFSILYTLAEMLALKVWKVTRPIFLLLSGKVLDSYWLILLGPAVLLSWLAGAVVLVGLSVVPAALAVALAFISLAVGVLLELPSDFINSKKDKKALNLSEGMTIALIWASILSTVALVVYAVSLVTPVA